MATTFLVVTTTDGARELINGGEIPFLAVKGGPSSDGFMAIVHPIPQEPGVDPRGQPLYYSVIGVPEEEAQAIISTLGSKYTVPMKVIQWL